jgi:hypothetical protein
MWMGECEEVGWEAEEAEDYDGKERRRTTRGAYIWKGSSANVGEEEAV